MFNLYKNSYSSNKEDIGIPSSKMEEELEKILVELENSLIKKAVNKIIVSEFGKEMPLLADKVYKKLPSTQNEVIA